MVTLVEAQAGSAKRAWRVEFGIGVHYVTHSFTRILPGLQPLSQVGRHFTADIAIKDLRGCYRWQIRRRSQPSREARPAAKRPDLTLNLTCREFRASVIRLNVNPKPTSESVSGFPPTQWTLLLKPIQDGSPEAGAALEQLCRSYWKPLYEFVQRRGYDHHTAQDVTQEFIGTLLRRNDLTKVRREHGKFRSFLLASLRNFLITRHRQASAQKRGDGVEPSPLEGLLNEEASDQRHVDREFDRQWAWQLIQRATHDLGREYLEAGKQGWFEDLKCFLSEGQPAISRASLAAKHGVEINAIDTAIHRLRKRYGKVLREQVAQTVETLPEVAEEVQYLMTVIGSGMEEPT